MTMYTYFLYPSTVAYVAAAAGLYLGLLVTLIMFSLISFAYVCCSRLYWLLPLLVVIVYILYITIFTFVGVRL